MNKFLITTDTGSNLTPDLTERYGIPTMVPIPFVVEGQERDPRTLSDDDMKAVYDQIRGKVVVTTAAAGDGVCKEIFEEHLKKGQDLLHIGFSSGLSVSYATAARVLDELKPKYPNQKILHIDSLAAVGGQARLVVEACKMREAGKSIEETAAAITGMLAKNKHLYTVESLQYLFRGGRLSRTSTILGTILQLKPILDVNPTGHLRPVAKVIGRKASLNDIAKRVAETIDKPEEQTIYINHGDCLDDAQYVAEQIASRVKVGGFHFSLLNITIGAHAGPGTVAVFFGEK